MLLSRAERSSAERVNEERLTSDERLKLVGGHSLLRRGVGQMIMASACVSAGEGRPNADDYGLDSVLSERSRVVSPKSSSEKGQCA